MIFMLLKPYSETLLEDLYCVSLVALCSKPQIAHGQLFVEKGQYVEQETITVRCDPGYDMVGPQTISCSENRTWYPQVPKCEWVSVHWCCPMDK